MPSLKFAEEQTPEQCMAAVKSHGNELQYVKEELQTPELCMVAVERHGTALKYVKEQTPDICMIAVEQDWKALQYVKEQTSDMGMAAVEQDCDALQYAKEQTPDMCMIAVLEDGKALKYVKEEFQSPEICEAAVQQNGDTIRYVKKELQTFELCSESIIKTKGHSLGSLEIESVTPNLCLYAASSLDSSDKLLLSTYMKKLKIDAIDRNTEMLGKLVSKLNGGDQEGQEDVYQEDQVGQGEQEDKEDFLCNHEDVAHKDVVQQFDDQSNDEES